MKEMSFQELTNIISFKKEQIDRDLLRRKSERNVRRRPRDPDEMKALDKLCMERWQEALRTGKVKYISKREWYYEPLN